MGTRAEMATRFWSKVERHGVEECWPWKAAMFPTGYGQFLLHGKPTTAHRVAFYLTYGYLPSHGVGHTCAHRWCVNPAHVFAGTRRENMPEDVTDSCG